MIAPKLNGLSSTCHVCFREWTKPRIRWVIYAVIPVLLVTTLVNMPPFTPCAMTSPITDHQYWVRANKIVVQPWLGSHHVYGIFIVPLQYKRHRLYSAKLLIEGVADDLPEISPEAGSMYGDQVDSGHYVIRVHLQTRMAFWLLVTGRFGNLKSACHWWLIIANR